ncbi:MAG: hypothetical protein EOO01_01760, partial [Chitinophagaceae bacterium]
DEEGKCNFKYIVEGANLFITQQARLSLEKHGVISHLTIIPFERIPEIVKIYENSSFQGRIVVKMSD